MGLEKTNAILNLMNNLIQQPDVDETNLYVRDPFESKYQLLINWTEKVGIKRLNNSKAFIDSHKQLMRSIKDYITTKKREGLMIL